MSHTHEDRVAQRDPCMCVAYGCPLMGTMTGSTSGANDWSCTYHANKLATERDQITFAINAHRWLAEAITAIRSGLVPSNPERGKLLERLERDFAKAGRSDLFWDGTETVRVWVNRLDEAFDKLVAPELLSRPAQMALPKDDTWQQASRALPNWA